MWNDILLNLQVIKGHADFTGKIPDFHHVSPVLTSSSEHTPASLTGPSGRRTRLLFDILIY